MLLGVLLISCYRFHSYYTIFLYSLSVCKNQQVIYIHLTIFIYELKVRHAQNGYNFKCRQSLNTLHALLCVTMTDEDITRFEPHVIAEVKKNGTVSVGRKYAGRKVYVYIVREDQDESKE